MGKILKPHGLKGLVSCFLENTEDSQLCSGKSIYINEKIFKVEKLNTANAKKTLLKLEGLESIEDLSSVLGQEIYMNREDFAEAIYLNDFIGCDVFSSEKSLGKVDNFYSNGVQDIMVIKGEKTLEVLVIDQFIKNIDLENKKIELHEMEIIE